MRYIQCMYSICTVIFHNIHTLFQDISGQKASRLLLSKLGLLNAWGRPHGRGTHGGGAPHWSYGAALLGFEVTRQQSEKELSLNCLVPRCAYLLGDEFDTVAMISDDLWWFPYRQPFFSRRNYVMEGAINGIYSIWNHMSTSNTLNMAGCERSSFSNPKYRVVSKPGWWFQPEKHKVKHNYPKELGTIWITKLKVSVSSLKTNGKKHVF